MKDSEFIALLNLYLDHEISPDDSTRLEAAVATDPDRRRIYRQYCQIQRACSILAEEERAAAPDEAVVSEPPVRGGRGAYSAAIWLGGLAAAAGVAVMLAVGAGWTAPRTARHAPAVAAVAAPAPARPMRPVFVAGSETPAAAQGLSTDFAWMKTIQFAPVQPLTTDQLLTLDAKQTLELDVGGVVKQPDDRSGKMAAFQFQH